MEKLLKANEQGDPVEKFRKSIESRKKAMRN
jgi:hypothetical protein